MTRARRSALALLLCALGAAPACAPDESSVGGVFRPEPGLVAEYFARRDLQGPAGTYRDASLDFEGWELNARIAARGHAAHTVSIRWSGQLRFAHAEPYTLAFELRGRARLWIDDAPVIDDWVDGGDLREARAIVAVAGEGWRDLRVEWDQADGPMTARLRFQSASQPRTIVPAGDLRHLEP